MKTPDLFVNVHKGIRRALFETIGALSRGAPDARSLLKTTLRFLEHHGANEDVLLIPLARTRVPELAARMERAHERITPLFTELQRASESMGLDELFTLTNGFLAAYLQHMHEEETAFDSGLRAAFSAEELSAFGMKSAQRTQPADQLMMLGWMLPAIPRDQAEVFLNRVPPEAAATLRRQLND
ncbi:MAG: hemerythrin domain-containing protein [Archangium sp.]|nr:hemerythrin domain-containing protein [Archangium sp.]